MVATKRQGVKNHLRNLIALAKADGDLDRREMEYIIDLAKRNNVNLNVLTGMIKSADHVRFDRNMSKDEKFDMIFDYVSLMLADGVIDEEEMKICSDAARNLGFHNNIVSLLVRQISNGITEGTERSELKEKANVLLNY